MMLAASTELADAAPEKVIWIVVFAATFVAPLAGTTAETEKVEVEELLPLPELPDPPPLPEPPPLPVPPPLLPPFPEPGLFVLPGMLLWLLPQPASARHTLRDTTVKLR